ncbi:hypothetical protein [Pseudonocardia sp. TRM90224]|uniref:hypothetical protein n=1 Tax=Pseudonocardia sp. TRM90224 TaxID=2812678 RepID=UPI001E34B949|nr:hypothetical protein [Pseudonocardia sp. TRM90224]
MRADAATGFWLAVAWLRWAGGQVGARFGGWEQALARVDAVVAMTIAVLVVSSLLVPGVAYASTPSGVQVALLVGATIVILVGTVGALFALKRFEPQLRSAFERLQARLEARDPASSGVAGALPTVVATGAIGIASALAGGALPGVAGELLTLAGTSLLGLAIAFAPFVISRPQLSKNATAAERVRALAAAAATIAVIYQSGRVVGLAASGLAAITFWLVRFLQRQRGPTGALARSGIVLGIVVIAMVALPGVANAAFEFPAAALEALGVLGATGAALVVFRGLPGRVARAARGIDTRRRVLAAARRLAAQSSTAGRDEVLRAAVAAGLDAGVAERKIADAVGWPVAAVRLAAEIERSRAAIDGRPVQPESQRLLGRVEALLDAVISGAAGAPDEIEMGHRRLAFAQAWAEGGQVAFGTWRATAGRLDIDLRWGPGGDVVATRSGTVVRISGETVRHVVRTLTIHARSGKDASRLRAEATAWWPVQLGGGLEGVVEALGALAKARPVDAPAARVFGGELLAQLPSREAVAALKLNRTGGWFLNTVLEAGLLLIPAAERQAALLTDQRVVGAAFLDDVRAFDPAGDDLPEQASRLIMPLWEHEAAVDLVIEELEAAALAAMQSVEDARAAQRAAAGAELVAETSSDRFAARRKRAAQAQQRAAADDAARFERITERYLAAVTSALALREAFSTLGDELSNLRLGSSRKVGGVVDAAVGVVDAAVAYEAHLAAALPALVAAKAAAPTGGLPDPAAIVAAVNEVLGRDHYTEEELRKTVLAGWPHLAGDGLVLELPGADPVELRLRWEPTRLAPWADPNRSASQVMRGWFPQGNPSVGAGSVRNAGFSVGVEADKVFDSLSDGPSWVKAFFSYVGLKFGFRLGRTDTPGRGWAAYHLGGGVTDNRGPSIGVVVAGTLDVAKRTVPGPGSDGSGWSTPVVVRLDNLQMWLPEAYAEGPAEWTLTRPATEIGEGTPFPPPAVLAATGMNAIADDVLASAFDAEHNEIGNPVRSQVRAALVHKLPGQLKLAIDDRVIADIRDEKGQVLARLTSRAELVRDGRGRLARMVGWSTLKEHIEDLRIAFSALFNSDGFGWSLNWDVTAGLKIPENVLARLLTLPVVGPVLAKVMPSLSGKFFGSIGRAIGASVSRVGIRAGVHRFSGHTQGYEGTVRFVVEVERFDSPRMARVTTVSGDSVVLMRLPEPDAYRYGLPVDAAAVDCSSGCAVLRDDPEMRAPEGKELRLPDWMGTGPGKVNAVGQDLVRDMTAVPAARDAVLEGLRGLGFVPPATAAERAAFTGGREALGALLENERNVDGFLSAARLETGFDEAIGSGLVLPLTRRPRGQSQETAFLRARLVPVWTNAEPEGMTDAWKIVGLPIGSDTVGESASASRSFGWGGSLGFGAGLGPDTDEAKPGAQTATTIGGSLAGDRSAGTSAGQSAGITGNGVLLVESRGESAVFRLGYHMVVSLERADGTATPLLDRDEPHGTFRLMMPEDWLPDAEPLRDAPVFRPTAELLKGATFTAVDFGALQTRVVEMVPGAMLPGSPDAGLIAFTGVDHLAQHMPELISSGLIYPLAGGGYVQLTLRPIYARTVTNTFMLVGGINLTLSSHGNERGSAHSRGGSVSGGLGFHQLAEPKPGAHGGLSGGASTATSDLDLGIAGAEGLRIEAGAALLNQLWFEIEVRVVTKRGAVTVGDPVPGTAMFLSAEREWLERYADDELPLPLDLVADVMQRAMQGEPKLDMRTAYRLVKRYSADLAAATSPERPAWHSPDVLAGWLAGQFPSDSVNVQEGGLSDVLQDLDRRTRVLEEAVLPRTLRFRLGESLIERARFYACSNGCALGNDAVLDVVESGVEAVLPGVLDRDVRLKIALSSVLSGDGWSGHLDTMLSPTGMVFSTYVRARPRKVVGDRVERLTIRIKAELADDAMLVGRTDETVMIKQRYGYVQRVLAFITGRVLGGDAGGSLGFGSNGSGETNRNRGRSVEVGQQRTNLMRVMTSVGSNRVRQSVVYTVEISSAPVRLGRPRAKDTRTEVLTLTGSLIRLITDRLVAPAESAAKVATIDPDPVDPRRLAVPHGSEIDFMLHGTLNFMGAPALDENPLRAPLEAALRDRRMLGHSFGYNAARLTQALTPDPLNAKFMRMLDPDGHPIVDLALRDRPGHGVEVRVRAVPSDRRVEVGEHAKELGDINRLQHVVGSSVTTGHITPPGIGGSYSESGVTLGASGLDQGNDRSATGFGLRNESPTHETGPALTVTDRIGFAVQVRRFEWNGEKVYRGTPITFFVPDVGFATINGFVGELAAATAAAETVGPGTSWVFGAPTAGPGPDALRIELRDLCDDACPGALAGEVTAERRAVLDDLVRRGARNGLVLTAVRDRSAPHAAFDAAQLLAVDLGLPVRLELTEANGAVRTVDLFGDGTALGADQFDTALATLDPHVRVAADQHLDEDLEVFYNKAGRPVRFTDAVRAKLDQLGVDHEAAPPLFPVDEWGSGPEAHPGASSNFGNGGGAHGIFDDWELELLFAAYEQLWREIVAGDRDARIVSIRGPPRPERVLALVGHDVLADVLVDVLGKHGIDAALSADLIARSDAFSLADQDGVDVVVMTAERHRELVRRDELDVVLDHELRHLDGGFESKAAHDADVERGRQEAAARKAGPLATVAAAATVAIVTVTTMIAAATPAFADPADLEPSVVEGVPAVVLGLAAAVGFVLVIAGGFGFALHAEDRAAAKRVLAQQEALPAPPFVRALPAPPVLTAAVGARMDPYGRPMRQAGELGELPHPFTTRVVQVDGPSGVTTGVVHSIADGRGVVVALGTTSAAGPVTVRISTLAGELVVAGTVRPAAAVGDVVEQAAGTGAARGFASKAQLREAAAMLHLFVIDIEDPRLLDVPLGPLTYGAPPVVGSRVGWAGISGEQLLRAGAATVLAAEPGWRDPHGAWAVYLDACECAGALVEPAPSGRDDVLLGLVSEPVLRQLPAVVAGQREITHPTLVGRAVKASVVEAVLRAHEVLPRLSPQRKAGALTDFGPREAWLADVIASVRVRLKAVGGRTGYVRRQVENLLVLEVSGLAVLMTAEERLVVARELPQELVVAAGLAGEPGERGPGTWWDRLLRQFQELVWIPAFVPFPTRLDDLPDNWFVGVAAVVVTTAVLVARYRDRTRSLLPGVGPQARQGGTFGILDEDEHGLMADVMAAARRMADEDHPGVRLVGRKSPEGRGVLRRGEGLLLVDHALLLDLFAERGVDAQRAAEIIAKSDAFGWRAEKKRGIGVVGMVAERFAELRGTDALRIVLDHERRFHLGGGSHTKEQHDADVTRRRQAISILQRSAGAIGTSAGGVIAVDPVTGDEVRVVGEQVERVLAAVRDRRWLLTPLEPDHAVRELLDEEHLWDGHRAYQAPGLLRALPLGFAPLLVAAPDPVHPARMAVFVDPVLVEPLALLPPAVRGDLAAAIWLHLVGVPHELVPAPLVPVLPQLLELLLPVPLHPLVHEVERRLDALTIAVGENRHDLVAEMVPPLDRALAQLRAHRTELQVSGVGPNLLATVALLGDGPATPVQIDAVVPEEMTVPRYAVVPVVIDGVHRGNAWSVGPGCFCATVSMFDDPSGELASIDPGIAGPEIELDGRPVEELFTYSPAELGGHAVAVERARSAIGALRATRFALSPDGSNTIATVLVLTAVQTGPKVALSPERAVPGQHVTIVGHDGERQTAHRSRVIAAGRATFAMTTAGEPAEIGIGSLVVDAAGRAMGTVEHVDQQTGTVTATSAAVVAVAVEARGTRTGRPFDARLDRVEELLDAAELRSDDPADRLATLNGVEERLDVAVGELGGFQASGLGAAQYAQALLRLRAAADRWRREHAEMGTTPTAATKDYGRTVWDIAAVVLEFELGVVDADGGRLVAEVARSLDTPHDWAVVAELVVVLGADWAARIHAVLAALTLRTDVQPTEGAWDAVRTGLAALLRQLPMMQAAELEDVFSDLAAEGDDISTDRAVDILERLRAALSGGVPPTTELALAAMRFFLAWAEDVLRRRGGTSGGAHGILTRAEQRLFLRVYAAFGREIVAGERVADLRPIRGPPNRDVVLAVVADAALVDAFGRHGVGADLAGGLLAKTDAFTIADVDGTDLIIVSRSQHDALAAQDALPDVLVHELRHLTDGFASDDEHDDDVRRIQRVREARRVAQPSAPLLTGGAPIRLLGPVRYTSTLKREDRRWQKVLAVRDAEGRRHVVKRGSVDRLQRNVEAAAFYRAAGGRAAQSRLALVDVDVVGRLGRVLVPAGEVIELADHVEGRQLRGRDRRSYEVRRQLAAGLVANALIGDWDALENRNLILTPAGLVVRIDFDMTFRNSELEFEDQLLEQLIGTPDVYGLLSPQDVMAQLRATVRAREQLLAMVHDGPERKQLIRHFGQIEQVVAAGRLPAALIDALEDARRYMGLSGGDAAVAPFDPPLFAVPTGREVIVDRAGLRRLLDAGRPVAVHGMRARLEGEVWKVAVGAAEPEGGAVGAAAAARDQLPPEQPEGDRPRPDPSP